MRKAAEWIEHNFWLVNVGCMGIGFILRLHLPKAGDALSTTWGRWILQVLLMGILYFTCLKLNTPAALRGVARRAWLFLYIVLVLLVVMPLLTRFTFANMLPAFAVGLTILAAMPAGLTGGALADLAGARVELAFSVIVITSLICPFISPPIIGALLGREVVVSRFQMFLMLARVLFTPIVAAEITKKFAGGWVRRNTEVFTAMAILCGSVLAGALMWANAQFIMEHIGQTGLVFAMLWVMVGVFQLIGYWCVSWLEKGERVSIAINAGFINNGIAMVFISQFFEPVQALPALLAGIPMIVMVLPLRKFMRRGEKNV